MQANPMREAYAVPVALAVHFWTHIGRVQETASSAPWKPETRLARDRRVIDGAVTKNPHSDTLVARLTLPISRQCFLEQTAHRGRWYERADAERWPQK